MKSPRVSMVGLAIGILVLVAEVLIIGSNANAAPLGASGPAPERTASPVTAVGFVNVWSSGSAQRDNALSRDGQDRTRQRVQTQSSTCCGRTPRFRIVNVFTSRANYRR